MAEAGIIWGYHLGMMEAFIQGFRVWGLASLGFRNLLHLRSMSEAPRACRHFA